MKPFSIGQERLLLALAAAGFIVPNGVFLFYLMAEPAIFKAALRNPVALVFIAEAFFLMFLFAGVIRRQGFRAPGWFAFIALSLAGSMAFSVPAFLYLASRRARKSLAG